MFKFKIGDKVHHRGHLKNAIVRNQIETTDFMGTYISYDLYISTGGEALPMLDNCPEFWIDEGHRIE